MLPPDRGEVQDRLRLIEAMMAEGRRTTERWGWSLLLWGIGPLMAMWWAARWPHGAWAWPVTMSLCAIINGVVVKARRRPGKAETTTMRSVGAVWTCTGITVLFLAFGAVASRTLEFRFLYVAVFALAAVAHGTSSLILRWWPQFLAALVWWIASALAFVVPVGRLPQIAAFSLILANVVFGAWLTSREWRRRNG